MASSVSGKASHPVVPGANARNLNNCKLSDPPRLRVVGQHFAPLRGPNADQIAIESAYRAHGELEARDRMVDTRAIALHDPMWSARGPAVRDQVTPSLIMSNGVPQCPGRDIIIRN